MAEIPAEAHGQHLMPARRLLPVSALALLARLTADLEGVVQVLFGSSPGLLPRRFRHPANEVHRRGVSSVATRSASGTPVSGPRVGRALPVRCPAGRRRPRNAAGGRLLLRFEPGRVTRSCAGRPRAWAGVRRPLPLSGTVIEMALKPDYLVELL